MRSKSGIWTQAPESIFLTTNSWLRRSTWRGWLVWAQWRWGCAQSRSLWFNLWDPPQGPPFTCDQTRIWLPVGCALEGRGFSPSCQVLRLSQYSLFKTKEHEWSLRSASVNMESMYFLFFSVKMGRRDEKLADAGWLHWVNEGFVFCSLKNEVQKYNSSFSYCHFLRWGKVT